MVNGFQEVLARYEARAAAEQIRWKTEDAASIVAHLDEFLLHVGKEVADLLLSLAIARDAKRIVELGTSYGYSTLFLAEAARRTGGRVSTYEISPEKQAYARDQLRDAGLDSYVDWRLGDAVTLLEDEPADVDFVLIDLWKDLYVPCFEKLYPKLVDQAVIVADNMLLPEHVRAVAGVYRSTVRAKPDIQSMLLPIGEGIELSCVWRGQS